MTKITFGGNFFIGGKSAALKPFSTVSQVGDTSDWRIIALDFSHRSLKIYLKKDVKSPLSRRYGPKLSDSNWTVKKSTLARIRHDHF